MKSAGRLAAGGGSPEVPSLVVGVRCKVLRAQNRARQQADQLRFYYAAALSFSRKDWRARSNRTRMPVELIPAVREISSAV
jgi:hypothetical protein